ncbi:Bug family tripartite tricarboxylate transporter substrate binding protein [Achromobacter aloeverae]
MIRSLPNCRPMRFIFESVKNFARHRSIKGAGLAAGMLSLALGATVPTTSSAATDYPSRPIKMVLGFSAGGGTDAIARMLAKKMTELLGQNVIVDNRPGANGNLAAETVVRSPADGYTILYNTSSIASSPALYKHLSYSVERDLVPVSLTVDLPQVLVVPAKSPFKTVQDLVAYAKAHPGKLNYASAGLGNVTHLAAISFDNAVGIKATHVPYKGEAPAIADIMAGQVDYYWATSAGAISAVQSGRIRALAIATKQPVATLPGVPTLDSTVAKGVYVSSWSGVMAPAGTPKEIVDKLNKAINAALEDKEVLRFFDSQSAIARPSTQKEYGVFLQQQIAELSAVIKSANLTLE